ncbi:uncharacterized protein [Ambystoma mexicanum]|uniref:uncharacterized protein isoform X1 n=1 Tax=Ambystoma mexicanum TaxID=8296 RepID=UPI0037E86329
MADLQVGSVLVTGSNRGIGLELVKKFLESPVPPDWVFATCRDPEGPKAQELKALASEHSNLMVLQLDVTNHSSILEAAKKVESKLDGSGLNLVINNAAMMHRTMLHDSTREDLMESYDNNVIGPLLVSQVFLPLLKKAAQGNPAAALSCKKAAVINISAVLGSIELVPELLDFCPVIPYRLSKIWGIQSSSLCSRHWISSREQQCLCFTCLCCFKSCTLFLDCCVPLPHLRLLTVAFQTATKHYSTHNKRSCHNVDLPTSALWDEWVLV